jgi:hypothetical protein
MMEFIENNNDPSRIRTVRANATPSATKSGMEAGRPRDIFSEPSAHHYHAYHQIGDMRSPYFSSADGWAVNTWVKLSIALGGQ